MSFISYSQSNRLHYYFCVIVLTQSLGSSLFGIVHTSRMYFVHEETVNGVSFKTQLEIDNGTKIEKYFVHGKTVSASEYDEALGQAEKEEKKRERSKAQEERLKQYETLYKGNVKIAQLELKKAVSVAQAALAKMLEPKLQPYLVFSGDTIADEKQLAHIKDTLLVEAVKLSNAAPEGVDLKRITAMQQELSALTPRLRAASIATVNNGISKADDTKLLKELLALV